ncbi:MAG: bifunctional demethylmenaquinone methyltransferase/2-methoxy-6-polyprenyl-1,4-benzoquinol methylase UbiE [Bacteroidia bacterium]
MAQVTPYHHSEKSKREQVEKMFDHIAPKYDFLNHFLSFGIDRSWRKTAINMLSAESPKLILDIATGTADFAIAASRLHPNKITGIDISERMLKVGHAKLRLKNLENKIQLMKADSEALPFADESYDAVTVAFGVRNFENLQKGLKEIYRVLKPKGSVVILEFSMPHKFPVRLLYKLYSKTILPLSGKIFANDAAAYTYLPASIEKFPSGYKFLSELDKAGFKENIFKPLTFGIATVYKGTKK